MEWEDAVITEITGEGTVAEGAPDRLRVQMTGFPLIEHKVDEGELEKRLSTHDVPAAVEQALEGYVEGLSSPDANDRASE